VIGIISWTWANGQWSRFSGGSGAPLWTLYACGIDPKGMNATEAALVHCDYPTAENPRPSSFPGMIWGTNYTRLVSETVFTLFFAGKTFAPKCIIDDINIQDYLQSHYFNAVGALAKKIKEAGGLYEECVIGWDSMNEPGEGLIGQKDVGVVPSDRQLKKGTTASPIQGMRLGMGQKQEVVVWDFGALGPKQSGTKVIDPKGQKLWLSQEDEATRGGGKWGWKRGKEWEMGTCSMSPIQTSFRNTTDIQSGLSTAYGTHLPETSSSTTTSASSPPTHPTRSIS
jgi:hypothetical protein